MTSDQDKHLSGQAEDAFVVFTPAGKRGHVRKGTTILEAARDLKVDLDSVCGGRGICGRCQVEPSFGEFSKFNIHANPDHVSAFSAVELRYQEKRSLKEKRRLGCSTKITGDMVIAVPEESQVHRQIIRKDSDSRDIRIDPVISLYYLEVPKPDMENPSGDLERINEALQEQWGVRFVRSAFPVLRHVQPALRKGKWFVTVALRDESSAEENDAGFELIWLWPGLQRKIYGLAVDLGSTTISAHLTNLINGQVVASAGLMNPQIRFGEDLMSRVSYAMMNTDGDQKMTEAVRTALAEMVETLIKDVEIAAEDIVETVLVGNPVMHHLFLGINPVELGTAPFALATSQSTSVYARDCELPVNASSRIYFLPCIAGHVGADAAAVALSETPWLSETHVLIIDVGTNAELLLGNKDRLLACSSPTGPALEGAQISSGQRAAPGAVERVRISKETFEPRFRIIGSDIWSDEEAFDDVDLRVAGICGSGIIEVLAEMFLARLILPDGTINGALAEKTPRLISNGRVWDYLLYRSPVDQSEIRITQNDVRAIQLAKGALYAGARLLMDHMGISKLDRVVLAGAFGSHIDPKYALILGMVPDCLPDQVSSAGNAAGTGARIALLNKSARKEIEYHVRRIEKIETAIEPKFQEHFVGAMGIPHAHDPYQALRSVVELPEAIAFSGDGRKSKRRRQRTSA